MPQLKFMSIKMLQKNDLNDVMTCLNDPFYQKISWKQDVTSEETSIKTVENLFDIFFAWFKALNAAVHLEKKN